MRKVSVFALLLSLMLSTSFCLTACDQEIVDSSDSSSSSYTPYDPDEGKTPDSLEKEANVGYKERIAKWAQYVEYVTPETNKTVQLTKISDRDTPKHKTQVKTSEVNSELYQVASENKIFKNVVVTPAVIDEETGMEISPAVIENKQTATETSYKLYNAETGALLIEMNTVEYNTLGGKLLDETKKLSDQVEGKIVANDIDGLIIAEKRTHQLKTPDETLEGDALEQYPTFVSNYEEVVTYSVYDKQGNELLKDLTKEDIDGIESRKASENDAWKTQQLVSIADKTYVIIDGEIIKTFARGTEYDVPEYTEEVEHAYFTYGDYGYYVIESDPEMMQIGDFYMARVPGVSIEVINANKELAWKYATTSYHVAGYSVLSDGDIYICEYKMLEAGAQTFDIESGGMKFDVVHSRIDVETGAVTQLEKDFVAQKVYNNVTPEINTLLNNAATAEVLANCKVKDGYMLAQVQKYADGVLDSKTEIAVLDEEMNIVEILPKIIENQFGYVGFLDADTMLVNTITTDNSSVCYTADAQSGDLDLYFNSKWHNNYNIEYIKGGIFYQHKVYDYDWNLKYDLSSENEMYDYISCDVKGDTIFIKARTNAKGDIPSQTTVMIGYLSGAYGSATFETKVIAHYEGTRSNVEEKDDCYVVTIQNEFNDKVMIYDAFGNYITEWNMATEYDYDSYYNSDDEYNSVTYELTKSVTVNEIGDTGTYLVCVQVVKSLYSYNYYPVGRDNLSGTYYQYYILK